MHRIWCRLYLCRTIRKHFACPHSDKSHFRSRAPLLQEERFQLDMSRLASRSLALDHTLRCRRVTTRDLLCRLLGIASKLQQPVPLLSQAHAFTECSDPLSSATAEAIVDCFLLHAVIGYQPSLLGNHNAVPHAESVSVASPVRVSTCQH